MNGRAALASASDVVLQPQLSPHGGRAAHVGRFKSSHSVTLPVVLCCACCAGPVRGCQRCSGGSWGVDPWCRLSAPRPPSDAGGGGEQQWRHRCQRRSGAAGQRGWREGGQHSRRCLPSCPDTNWCLVMGRVTARVAASADEGEMTLSRPLTPLTMACTGFSRVTCPTRDKQEHSNPTAPYTHTHVHAWKARYSP